MLILSAGPTIFAFTLHLDHFMETNKDLDLIRNFIWFRFIVRDFLKFDFVITRFTRFWLFPIKKACKQNFQAYNIILKI